MSPVTLEMIQKAMDRIREQGMRIHPLILSYPAYQLYRRILKVDPGFHPEVSASIYCRALELGINL